METMQAHSNDSGQAALGDRHATRVITVRLRPDQHEALIAMAEHAGQSMNQFVLDVLLPPPTNRDAPFERWFAELQAHAAAFPARGLKLLSRLTLESAEVTEWRDRYDAGCTPREAWGLPRGGFRKSQRSKQ